MVTYGKNLLMAASEMMIDVLRWSLTATSKAKWFEENENSYSSSLWQFKRMFIRVLGSTVRRYSDEASLIFGMFELMKYTIEKYGIFLMG